MPFVLWGRILRSVWPGQPHPAAGTAAMPVCAAAASHPPPDRPLCTPDDLRLAAPIEPETLARAEPSEARRLIAALSPAQRCAQAVAQAAWLNSFGYPVTFTEILTVWEADEPRPAP